MNVKELGTKELLPSYRDPNLQLKDLPTGSAIPLSKQLLDLKQYTGKLKELVGEERTNFTLANGVTFVVASSNDIGTNYFVTGLRRWDYDIPSYTDFLVKSASNFVKELYGLGVRRISVFSAPPLGCVPAVRTLVGGLRKGCVYEPNEAAKSFNAKLSAELGNRNNTVPHSRVVYIDVYNPLLHLIENPKKYGLEIADKGCCGTGTVEVVLLCNQCYHPTEKAYKILANQLLGKYVNNSFL
ncbi:GDSL esterase/lipase EXL3-like [Corylus avellana]|uniref:GDSL esterase/lipase EXL3-like n=1 Tax=Corylus avellana TaxID=13451 RepID=UPI00286AA266|nr:GDSL esterase/lipase EXL3-like [Corylus avellana]